MLPKKKTTRPRKYSYYTLFNSILYVLISGCQWRMLPNDLSNWKTVHHYFLTWSKDEIFDEILKKSLKSGDYNKVKNEYPTLCSKCKSDLFWLTSGARLLTDTQSTKNTDWQGKELTGFDGGKKIKGIKKSVTVDTTGFPPNADFIQINTANTSEKCVKLVLRKSKKMI